MSKEPTPRPELKQFGDLTPADFERHPVWIGCHTADYDEPWYEETDEETFRPRIGALPADPSEGMLLVRATAALADGSRLPGFLTPAFEADDLGPLQPQVFVGGRMFSFWGGMFGVPDEARRQFYRAVGKPAEAVFPMEVAAEPALCSGVGRASV
ncbi:MAG TPA: hypothetical protein VFM88_09845, partial [Vicinamibacteria bacterium]|nr:hypothetical protein [Vicinamibacteria bacterium]